MQEPPINPLLVATLTCLRDSPNGIKEYALIQKLRSGDASHARWLRQFDLRDSLELFRCHFWVRNTLYQLQQTLWQEQRLWLEIGLIDIRLIVPAVDAHGHMPSQYGQRSALADYYLDWSNYSTTSADDVDQLIEDFWVQFNRYEQRQHNNGDTADALRILGLEHDCQWAQIQKRYRELAFKTHPDRGGSTSDFISVRAAYETLRQLYATERA